MRVASVLLAMLAWTAPAAAGAPGPARLARYDVSGRLVRTLLDADLPAGVHRATWDGRDAAGRPVAPGGYVARLEAAGGAATVRLELLR
jgi:flagellar hook assembly protein FlgD